MTILAAADKPLRDAIGRIAAIIPKGLLLSSPSD